MDDNKPFEVRILNFVCFFGAVAGSMALISRIVAGMPLFSMAPLILMIVSILCVFFISVYKAKYATLLTTIIVCAVSIVFWPTLYFTVGGHDSGMAVYFALAIILEFTLLKRKTRIFACLMTIAVVMACYASTLFFGWKVYPEHVSNFQRFVDNVQSTFIVGVYSGTIILFQVYMYKKEQQKVESANAERSETLSRLEHAQQTTSAMFEKNPHINILFDNKFQVMDCNPAAITFMGFASKQLFLEGFIERLVKSIPEFQLNGQRSVPLTERFATVVKEGSVRFETTLMLNGTIRSLDVEFKKIPYEGSFAVMAYVYDMTEAHEREMELLRRDKQLLEAVEEAKAANQAKSAFLSTMSHEIRTPMNAILGITEIHLQKEELDQDLKLALEKIYASGDMLLGIINDILDLSKIEAGKLELVIDKYELASMISDTTQLNMMRIGSKPIEFEIYVDENLPSILLGDELRVKQILNNLLSNAFKYTAKGTVELSVMSEKSPNEDEFLLVLRASDTGQGMTPEQINKLFDEYSRFNAEANRTTEGTGLGMSITQNLIRLMGGNITVESEPGKGSVFTVRLPQKKTDCEPLGEEMAANLHKFRTSSRAQMRRVQISREPMPYGKVLIVDDVETNIFVAKGLLAPYELHIDSVDSGYGAIEKVKNGYEYDVVFMDHMMPKMDGIEATKIMREMGYEKPIVALTANAISGQADLFLGNGFNDYISKPIDVRQLNSVLNKLVRDKHPLESAKAAKQTGPEVGPSDEKTHMLELNPRFAEIFARDA
ncbi:MAG: ATP-binding protein, partial [Oscillospiraceae bacterium]|nr:ATP-binding protein [Oscillospiraceae bacterium]